MNKYIVLVVGLLVSFGMQTVLCQAEEHQTHAEKIFTLQDVKDILSLYESLNAAKTSENKTMSYTQKIYDYLNSERGVEFILTHLTTAVIATLVVQAIIAALRAGTEKWELDAAIYYPGDIDTKFHDVAGLSGAKADLQDILLYLQKPKQFSRVGAKIPKGILLNGAPGNGKTLLARAFAGEVNCPFISVCGSSFKEMFIGLGALRIRSLFARAQALSEQYGACVIFIDEIDAIASQRGGISSEREHDQTVNQLLECMDGLDKSDHHIILIGATNKAELLDAAVVRPGRFDRIVQINHPFIKDRIELLQLALDKVPHVPTIDLKAIAQITSGFSAAKLTLLINEAAILAGVQGRKFITIYDIELAYDHITLGREIKGMHQSEEDRWKTAIHEAGHAVGWVFGKTTSYIIHKASIVPRSHTLGIVYATTLGEFYTQTEEEMRLAITVALCGGVAEELFGIPKSTGTSNDLAQARAIAYNMVVKYGMSHELQYISYDRIDQYLPNDVATQIHAEVKTIIYQCLEQARQIINFHKAEVEQIAQLLLAKGTVLGAEIYQSVGQATPHLDF